MEAIDPARSRIRFDDFEADLRTRELRREGRMVRLPNQSFLVLAALLEQPGELVTRDELRRRLWPEERFVDTEQSLNAAVNRLRDALRDSADNPRYIETLPRRGYRFVGTVEPAATPGIEPVAAGAMPPHQARPKLHQRADVILIALAGFVVVALVLWMLRASRDDETAADAPRVEPFTTLSGQEIAPAFAPDGRHLAFAWNSDDKGFDLYVKERGAEKALRLTSKPAEWISATWSPDGGHIAIARDSDASGGIYLIPAPLGGEERRLATASVTNSPTTQIAWSPDGERLVYSAYGKRGLTLYELSLEAPSPRALELDVDCWDLGSPAFSPNGKHIAFVCTTSFGVYSIYISEAGGDSPRALAKVLGTPKGLTWSTNGSHIIFANDSGDGGGLWQLDLTGRVSRLPLGEEASMPVAGPGGQIAYARGRERLDIWRLDLHSASPERDAMRLVSSTRIQMNPQYSPDGARIVFQSTRSGSSEIWVASADGSNPVRISSFNGPITGAPTWCSDGKRIAFDSRASGSSALYIADVEERQPRRLDTSVDNLALPVWSSDCRSLIGSKNGDALYIVDIESGTARRFTRQPSYYAGVSGNDVIFNVKALQGVSLWRKRIDGDEEKPLDDMPILSYTDSWAVTSIGVYFTLASEDPRTIRLYRFATRTIEPMARLERPTAPAGGLGLSISSDHRWLLYTRVEEQQSDIMLLKHE